MFCCSYLRRTHIICTWNPAEPPGIHKERFQLGVVAPAPSKMRRVAHAMTCAYDVCRIRLMILSCVCRMLVCSLCTRFVIARSVRRSCGSSAPAAPRSRRRARREGLARAAREMSRPTPRLGPPCRGGRPGRRARQRRRALDVAGRELHARGTSSRRPAGWCQQRHRGLRGAASSHAGLPILILSARATRMRQDLFRDVLNLHLCQAVDYSMQLSAAPFCLTCQVHISRFAAYHIISLAVLMFLHVQVPCHACM